MKSQVLSTQKKQYFFQGFLLGVLPLTLLFISFAEGDFSWSRTLGGVMTSLLLGSGIMSLFKRPIVGKTLFSAGIGSCILLLLPALCADPLFALFTGILTIASLYYLFGAKIIPSPGSKKELLLERFQAAALSQLLLTIIFLLSAPDHKLFSLVSLGGMLIMFYSFGIYLHSLLEGKKRKWSARVLLPFFILAAVLLYLTGSATLVTFLLGLLGFTYAVIRKKPDLRHLNTILNHPGRSLFLTFALLCGGGTLLLRTPAAMTEEIKVIDAAFTAVSGVCVTGLSVIDIASDLTLTGRFFLMLLIQAGGLGIMTLAAVTLHILGKRLSLDQELVLSEMTSARDQDIFQSLKEIIKVTFFCETLGALLLIPSFFNVHGDWEKAVELGIFTSISAFCNAGFFPDIANLAPYSGNYFILIVTALLIMAGGIAPAVTVSLLRRGRGVRLPLVSRLVLVSTLVLLGSSTFFLLLFEWDGIFRDLPAAGKFVNSFFLAVSLRTAGFNTVDMTASSPAAVITMLLAMFIGGSPGGTAGGVKSTTSAIILLALYAAIRGKDDVELDRHRIPGKSLIQAVAIISSAFFVLLAVIIMLVTTQTLGTKELIFESVSALGTVGLSLGITGELDPIGKVIIMATMFIGRIGPLTLFLLLSDKHKTQEGGYPPVQIPLG